MQSWTFFHDEQRGGARDWARSLTIPALDGLELVCAGFSKHVFPLHAHAEYVIGVVQSGAKATQVGRTSTVAGPGQLTLFNPYEEHASKGADTSWTFTAFYPTDKLVEKWFGRAVSLAGPVVEDALGAKIIGDLYERLRAPCSRLAAEISFVEAMSHFVCRHARDQVNVPVRTHDRIFRARELLTAEPDASLTRLAQEAGLPPATFLRGFRKQFGCTPRVYATARRIAAAKQALKSGSSVADVAADFGFCDQGHFTRVFRRWTGATPGSFARG